MAANKHLTEGWTYSELNGETGGWELDKGDGLVRIACKLTAETALAATLPTFRDDATPPLAGWYAFVVRQDTGETLLGERCATRDAAMVTAGGSIFRGEGLEMTDMPGDANYARLRA